MGSVDMPNDVPTEAVPGAEERPMADEERIIDWVVKGVFETDNDDTVRG